MARITHVKSAQARYATKQVLNEDGTPKRTVIRDTRTGEPKLAKDGRQQFMPVKVRDLDKPLPPHNCEVCKQPILPGSSYKHVSPKSGPYGGATRYRCAACPTWQPWDLSNALWARLAQIVSAAQEAADGADSAETVTEALSGAAEAIREISEEKREGAENIESGFGRSTEQSDALNEVADALEGWAEELEGAEIPDYPEDTDCEECDGGGTQDEECDTCGGEGIVNDGERCGDCDGQGEQTHDCAYCGGDGTVEPDIDGWETEVADALALLENDPT